MRLLMMLESFHLPPVLQLHPISSVLTITITFESHLQHCLISPDWTTAWIIYWKGAIKNLDAEADAFELAFVQQEGL
jgi:hypothetical protein